MELLITRRTCLTVLASGAMTGAKLLPRADAADAVPQIPLGFSLYGMKRLAVAEALSACAKIGYDGVELALMPDWPTEPKRLSAADRRELAQRLADSGLALHGLMENLAEPADEAVHRANLDRLKAAVELGHALSPKAPPVIETILGGKPAVWDAVREQLAGRLKDWSEVAADAKTVIVVKPHVANALHTPEGALWLMGQVNSPWLKLAYDYSHYVVHGLSMAETIAALVPQARFIHLKDARGTAEKFEFLLPGDGGLDYVDYFRRVQAAGYRGPAVVEVSGQISGKPGYDPLLAAQRSYENLAPAMQKAGVRAGK